MKLGNSKFTVMSESEYEDSRPEILLEESVILVNVFNPTKSQLSTWAHNKPKTNTNNSSILQKPPRNLSEIQTDLWNCDMESKPTCEKKSRLTVIAPILYTSFIFIFLLAM